MKYYIYSVKTDLKDTKQFAAVYDVTEFALHHFDPDVMKYEGVAVEAPDPKTAIKAFHAPASYENVIIAWEDEPEPMVNVREIIKSKLRIRDMLQESAEAAKLVDQTKQIASLLTQINILLSDAADVIHGRNNLIDREYIYTQMRKHVLNNFMEVYKYGDGRPKKS